MYTSFASTPSKYLILILTVRFLKGTSRKSGGGLLVATYRMNVLGN
jgi:hypothetical protein